MASESSPPRSQGPDIGPRPEQIESCPHPQAISVSLVDPFYCYPLIASGLFLSRTPYTSVMRSLINAPQQQPHYLLNIFSTKRKGKDTVKLNRAMGTFVVAILRRCQ
jgi:hypothetical protein